MSHARKRKSFEERSVLVWMQSGETYKQAKQRLDDLWQKGEHPTQLKELGHEI